MFDKPEFSYERRKRDRKEREKDDAHAEQSRAIQHNIEILLEKMEAEKEKSRSIEKKKLALETVTVILLFATAILTGLTYRVFYQQLGVSRDAIKTAHDDAEIALKRAHQDSLDALVRAHQDSENASRQAHADNAAALTEVQKTALAAQRSNSNYVAAERAHFASNAITISKKYDDDPSPVLNYSLSNTGGPATVIASQVECFVGSAIPKTVSYTAKQPRSAMSLIGTNNSFTTETSCTPDAKVTRQDYADIAAKRKSFLIWGYITFRDNFGEIFTQRFGMFGYESGKFYAMPIGAYNTEIKGYQR